jgi:hypothetical protein
MTNSEIYEFKGSDIIMLLAFGSVILLRYIEVIKLSWYIVFPLAFGAAVVIPAMIATLFFYRR